MPNARRVKSGARGCSSVGRALQSHCRGREFESPQLHQLLIDTIRLPHEAAAVSGSAFRRPSPARAVGRLTAPSLNSVPRAAGFWGVSAYSQQRLRLQCSFSWEVRCMFFTISGASRRAA
jgi:hypothetical protein